MTWSWVVFLVVWVVLTFYAWSWVTAGARADDQARRAWRRYIEGLRKGRR